MFGREYPSLVNALCRLVPELESFLTDLGNWDEEDNLIDEQEVVRSSSDLGICLLALGRLRDPDAIDYVKGRGGSLRQVEFTRGNLHDGTQATETVEVSFADLVDTLNHFRTYTPSQYGFAMDWVIGVEQE